MPKIFISYRREDSQWPARSLRDALIPHVRDPHADIFMDVDNVPLGVNFAEHTGRQLDGCHVVLAVIGPKWLEIKDAEGLRRLDNPTDFVRLEIAQALKRGIPVIPVLLDGAKVPRADQLPEEMRELSMRNGTEIRHATFTADAERLVRGLGLAGETKQSKASSRELAGSEASETRARSSIGLRLAKAFSKKRFALLIGAAATVALLSAAALILANSSSDEPKNVQQASSVIDAQHHEPAISRPGGSLGDAQAPDTVPPAQSVATVETAPSSVESPAISADAELPKKPRAVLVRTLRGHDQMLESAAFSSDGTQIVTASFDTTAKIWDAATGKVVRTLARHTKWVDRAIFSPDDKFIATIGWDNLVVIWDPATGAVIRTLSGGSGGGGIAFSPDGRHLAISGFKEVRVMDVATGERLAGLSGGSGLSNSVAFSPDGSRIVSATGDHDALVWDWASGRQIATLSGHPGTVWSAEFSPDGARIVTASSGGAVWIWDVATSKVSLKLTGHSGDAVDASFSRDGRRIVTAAFDMTARVWDAATGQTIATLSGHTNWVKTAEFSRDGRRVVTASGDNTAKIWRIEE